MSAYSKDFEGLGQGGYGTDFFLIEVVDGELDQTPLNLFLVSITLPDEPFTDPEPEPAAGNYIAQNLIDWLTFEEDSDSVVTGSHDGTIFNDIDGNFTITEDGFIGKGGETTGGALNTTRSNFLDARNQSFSVFMWVSRANDNTGYLAQKRFSGGNGQWHMFITGSVFTCQLRREDGTVENFNPGPSFNVPVNDWSLLVLSWNHQTREVDMWMNQEKFSSILDGEVATGVDFFNLLKHTSPGTFNSFEGKVDEVGFLSAPMTDEGQSWLYNNGQGRTLSDL